MFPKPKAGESSWSRLRRPAQYWFWVSRWIHSGVFGCGSPAGATQLMSGPTTGSALAGTTIDAAAHTESAHAEARRRTFMPEERSVTTEPSRLACVSRHMKRIAWLVVLGAALAIPMAALADGPT